MAEAQDVLSNDTRRETQTLALYRAVFEAAPQPMLLLAVDGRFTMELVNAAHLRAFRTTAEALLGRGLFDVFPPEPPEATRAFIDSVRASLDRVVALEAPDEMAVQAFSVVGPDGAEEERYWGATHTPVFGRNGRMEHILSTVRDLTAEVNERRGAEARALLMREVDHRARNALTVVQSVVRLTQAPDIASFKDVVLGRVEVLGRAQGSLARRKWEGADLVEVVEAELRALVAPGRYRVSGTKVLLRAEHVQAMSMVLHELATNATKYGALSLPDGHVDIDWTLADGRLVLVWSEAGGPAVREPARTGFGSRLIRQLAVQLGGEVTFQWRPAGLRVEVTAAL